MLRIVLVIFAVNLVLVGFILAGRASKKENTIWSTILLLIPLVGLTIHYLLSGRKEDKTASLKDWEKT